MSQMTLTQLVSRMPPQVGVAYMRLGEVLCEMAATLSMREDSIPPCALIVRFPSGFDTVIPIEPLPQSASLPILEAAALSSASAADSPLIPAEMLAILDTRWGIL